jgi:hypothetical protein
MKNLQTYEQFLVESTPNYTYDGQQLKVGDYVTSLDGFSGMIISKETSNGKIVFRDNKGVMHICESRYLLSHEEISEGLQWWEVTKGVLASDMLKAEGIAGGGIQLGGSLFNSWRNGISSKITEFKKSEKFGEYRKIAEKLAEKFNSDDTLKAKIEELKKYPSSPSIMPLGKRKSQTIERDLTERNKLMREIAKYVREKLDETEVNYIQEINKVLKGVPLVSEESGDVQNPLAQTADITRDPQQVNGDHTSINNDPNRTVGTGTYTSTWHDVRPDVKGTRDTTDSGSAGTIPTYVGN